MPATRAARAAGGDADSHTGGRSSRGDADRHAEARSSRGGAAEAASQVQEPPTPAGRHPSAGPAAARYPDAKARPTARPAGAHPHAGPAAATGPGAQARAGPAAANGTRADARAGLAAANPGPAAHFPAARGPDGGARPVAGAAARPGNRDGRAAARY